jgi:xanthine dehydrogenase YagR molybdenum-binding subunit
MSEKAIGAAIDRVDGRLKVTGAALYAADAPVAGVLHGFIVLSTIGRGRVQAIDADAARKAPGVAAVVTHENMPRLKQPGSDFFRGGTLNEDRLPLSDDRIHYAGQYLAVVVADTPEQARHAASLVKVAYSDEEPPLAALEDAREFEDANSDPFGQPIQYRRGDVEKALTARGLVTVDATYTTPVETHNPMEMAATIAQWDGDRLTVHDSTQWVKGTQAILAEAFGVPREHVRVLCPYLGGGFGCKGFINPHTVLAAAVARVVGRPVKLPLTRAQMFTGMGHRSATEQKLTVAATKDGTLTAIRHVTTQSTSFVGDWMETCGNSTSQVMYACPNVQVVHRLARLNIGSPTFMRGPGEMPGTFALESALDELAGALGMDPVALRVRNHTAVNPASGKPWSSNYLKECYALAAERFGWHQRTPGPRSMRDGHWLVGWGMATATYPGFRFPASARIRLSADGRARVGTAGHELGTGAYTVYTQAAADALGLPVAKVYFELGDSNLPHAPVAGGSNSTASITEAVVAAAAQTRAKLVRLAVADAASPLHGLPEDQVTLRDGRLVAAGGPSRGEPVAAVLERARLTGVEGEASAHLSAEKADKFAFQSFGAHFCEVKVDEQLGRVRVTRWVGAFDPGRVLNPKTARSQVLGGIVMGIGAALMEHTVYDRRTARPVTDNLVDYAVPVHADSPPIETHFIDRPDPYINTLGCRGVGELSITGVAAAVANAVHHATGKRVRALPITPDKLLPQDAP